MEKPFELKIEETKNSLVSIINNSTLPHYMMLPILSSIYEEYKILSANETERIKKVYFDSMKEAEQEKED